MGMTIDEAIDFLEEGKYSYESPSSDTLDVAINTMRKYQKIEQILDDWTKPEEIEWAIREVLDNGNDN